MSYCKCPICGCTSFPQSDSDAWYAADGHTKLALCSKCRSVFDKILTNPSEGLLQEVERQKGNRERRLKDERDRFDYISTHTTIEVIKRK